ncbi:MAG: hypothetical protein IH600_04280 [Bacteroidetes bacterium]|nr:hypothetical protein [Bacteroidota bacterium]
MSETEELAAKYLPAYERWLKLRARVQVSFHMTYPSVLTAGEMMSVRIFEADRSAKLGVELLAVMPPYFIQGTLTDEAVQEIAPLLRGIHRVTGRSFEDAVALLATFQVFVLDTLRLNESVGIREVWTTFENEILPGIILEEDWSEIFAPEFSPQKIRALWDTAVVPFLHWYLGRYPENSEIVRLDFVPPISFQLVPFNDLKAAADTQAAADESETPGVKNKPSSESEKCAEITRRFREHYRKHGRKKDYYFVLLDYSYRHEELKFSEAVRQFLELYGHPEPDVKPKSVASSAYGKNDEHELDIGDKSLSDADWLLERTEKDIREKFDPEP